MIPFERSVFGSLTVERQMERFDRNRAERIRIGSRRVICPFEAAKFSRSEAAVSSSSDSSGRNAVSERSQHRKDFIKRISLPFPALRCRGRNGSGFDGVSPPLIEKALLRGIAKYPDNKCLTWPTVVRVMRCAEAIPFSRFWMSRVSISRSHMFAISRFLRYTRHMPR
jgi:hypothetical protein